jgi:chromosome segregation ATPase
MYRAEALLDHPPGQDAQGAGDVSAVEKVMTALVERDDALRRAHEDLARARSVAASWEAEVASARAQLQQDRAAIEGVWAWQSQAEKAKEAEGLRTTLASKAAALIATEEQLRQEGAARQQAKTQLQQERAALAEARAAHLAWEEALGWLQ